MIGQSSPVKVSIITLGCSKNLVDAECMSSILENEGYQLVPSMDQADVIVINTCGFIESAKREAIDTILEAADYKKPLGKASKIIVTGCLSQRYPNEILSDLPEVDAVLGTGHYQNIADVIKRLLSDSCNISLKYVSKPGGTEHLALGRNVSTFPYAWLKISEGCSNACAYCAIPIIRGPFQSRPMEDIVKEAIILSGQGYKEIILAGQDTTSYGKDLYKKLILPDLIREISKIDGIDSIRIMYAYIDGITDDLIYEMKNNSKVAHYLDIPVQHGDDGVLRRMGRKDRTAGISSVIDKLRNEMPDIILRSTVIVGFPGETDEEFHALSDMVRFWRFDRLGCFIFSSEEGTRAADMKDPVPESIALERFNQLMTIQKEISYLSNQKRLGSTFQVTIDSVSDDGIFYIGRSYGEAPEVDPVIHVLATSSPLIIGGKYNVSIVDCSAYDMTGVTVNEFTE
ncbi:MAG: 30S ribosomal protein S12 methylthiotransferase RimO [Clostridiaceae bacterium]|nr:30S ribosomal protein S12 methylthiotransferase RimO [Clostridiaceae bacterium]